MVLRRLLNQSVLLSVFLFVSVTGADEVSKTAPKAATKKTDKNLLDVKNQVSDDLRKQKNQNKQEDKKASAAPEHDPNRKTDNLFGQDFNLTCQGDLQNCRSEPKRKVLPTRSDGLELGK